jgi:lipid II:glycine glycyltransferase (peptidoglycan interpeptide bridge formation enzyme)
MHDFLALYKPFVRRSGFEGKRDDYFDCLSTIIPTIAEGAIYFASYQGHILSTAIVIYYGKTATFLYGASAENDKNCMAPYLMQWRIIEDAQQAGYTTYDLYSLSPGDGTTHHPWDGFSEFKRKFGGTEINYTGAYDFVYNEDVYKRYLKEDVGIRT